MKRLVLLFGFVVLFAGCGSRSSPLASALTGTNETGGIDLAGPTVAEKSILQDPVTLTNSTASVPAPVAPVAVPAPQPPPDLPVPAAEVVRLSQHVLGESVLVDYINSINEPFALNADQVIYLTDLGMPQPVIQALIKRTAVFVPARSNVAEAWVPAVATPSPMETSELGGTNSILTNYLVSTNPGYPAGTPYFAAPMAMTGPQGIPTVQAPPAPQPISELASTAPVDNAQIYTALAPYGDWVEDPDYGWSWQPTVAVVDTGWRPYLNAGNWAWTDAGWYWNSSYTWGWLPFHYGRWTLTTSRGWIWVPDSVWGPAWVTWRSTDTLCGWAPLPPGAYWRHGEGLYYRGAHVGVGFDFGLGEGWYCAVPFGRFCDPWVYRHCVPGPTVSIFIGNSRIVNDYRYGVGPGRGQFVNHGPGVVPVEKATRGEVVKYNLNDLPRPGGVAPIPGRSGGPAAGGHSLSVYRGNLPSVPVRPPAPVLASQSDRQVHDTPYSASLAPRSAAPVASSTFNAPSGERGSANAGATGYANSASSQPRNPSLQPPGLGRPTGYTPSSGGTVTPANRTISTGPGASHAMAAEPAARPTPSTGSPSIANAYPGRPTTGALATGAGGGTITPRSGRSEPPAATSNPDVFSHSEAAWSRSSPTPRPLSDPALYSAGLPAGSVPEARPSPTGSYQQSQYGNPQVARPYSPPPPTYYAPQSSQPAQHQYQYSAPAPAPQQHYTAPPPVPAPSHSGGGSAQPAHQATGNRKGN